MPRRTSGARTLTVSVGVIVLSSLLAGCRGGGDRVGAPAAPSAAADAETAAAMSGSSAMALKVERVLVCHADRTTSSWVPIRIAPAAVPAHLAHGDARVGDPVPGRPGARFDDNCTVTASAVTITFAGLSNQANQSPFTTYTESGFTVSRVSGAWVALTTYGAPAPSIIFTRSASDPTITADVQITAGGPTFTFASVDLYSSVTEIPFEFVGRLNGAVVFTTSGNVPNTFGAFVTVANPFASQPIDQLTITLTNPATTPCCSNPVGLDNVSLAR